ncbi:MAG: SUMF1/EgtB/PvdO family nonheme iron enzyme [Deltaproteobacteria bacterium]|nr:SUMF1/EgtB/PvdO family nonheme iron enzyme [Deltaproteobacteria bacterium]
MSAMANNGRIGGRARPMPGCLIAVAGVWCLAGCVDQRCFEQADCPTPKICSPTGRCVYECQTQADCMVGFTCVDHRCRPTSSGPVVCPADMVSVANAFCIDRHEASRNNATAIHAGTDESMPRSVADRIPWQVDSNQEAEQACQAAGKRLCSPAEWQYACTGPDRTVYAYGNEYQPQTCNGIDTFGRNNFHLLPTGSFPGCTNEWGAFDLNGNLWEHVAGGDETTIRGGAYNCGDSATYQRCDYIPTSWTPSARGFRCCLTPVVTTDAGLNDAGPTEAGPADGGAADADAASESGCIDDDRGVPGDGGSDAAVGDAATGDAARSDSAVGDTAASDGAPCDAARSDTAAEDAGAEDRGIGCPSDMVPIGSFCIDIYEASRSGSNPNVARSERGVIPWFPITLAQARAGCAAAGKRLCRPEEWITACQGPDHLAYSYGPEYDPVICNGIDTYCYCSSGSCAGLAVCPYPHCYNEPSTTEIGGPCGSYPQYMPTGSFPSCTNSHGIFDINGNVWEIVDTSDGLEHFRGGAYNCINSVELHKCTHDETRYVTAKGFRCCKDRSP